MLPVLSPHLSTFPISLVSFSFALRYLSVPPPLISLGADKGILTLNNNGNSQGRAEHISMKNARETALDSKQGLRRGAVEVLINTLSSLILVDCSGRRMVGRTRE